MASTYDNKLRAMLIGAIRAAKRGGIENLEMLGRLIEGKFDAELSEGKTLISTSEAGGTATFAMIGVSPDDIAAMACECLTILTTEFDDPNAVVWTDLIQTKRIKRLRVSFAKATI